NIDSRTGAGAQQRFKEARAPIRLLQISISQSLLGDFCNTILPIADSRSAANSASFNYLIGAQREAGRDFMSDGLGSPEIDHQLENSRLLDRDIGRLDAAQYAGNQTSALAKHPGPARAVTDEAPFLRYLRPLVHRRHSQGYDAIEQRPRVDYE